MDFREIIELKKKGQTLTAEQIANLVAEFTAGRLPPHQMSAFLMAVWFQGMDAAETVALTDNMLRSGATLDVSHMPGPTADKHSTGGVGDKVSLLLTPLAAACGLYVPMLSGRGLGHTGGTLDKLEAIPGYQIHLPNTQFLDIVAEVGCSIVGQSGDITPADGKIYALRDVTGTVDCVPLITASILSKKLAAGPETIIIDLKTGSGAFMTDAAKAQDLARTLVSTAAHWQRRLAVIFSDMSQPLGVAVGHASETCEAFTALRPDGRGRAPQDLVRLTEALVVEMLLVSGLQSTPEAALTTVREVWDTGRAFQKLLEWVAAQDGVLEPDRDDFGLEIASRSGEAIAASEGYVREVDCRQIGYALADLGGARQQIDADLNLHVGIDFLVNVGDRVQSGQPLAILRGGDAQQVEAASHRIQSAVILGEVPVSPPPLIQGRLGPEL